MDLWKTAQNCGFRVYKVSFKFKIMQAKEKILKSHQLLKEKYGDRVWKPRRDPMHELISTMLSHRTTNANEAKAYEQMREKFGSYEAIMNADFDELADTLSPAQFPGQKAANIQKTLRKILDERGEFNIDFLADVSEEEGLKWLTSLPGVGVKTATLVLLFNFKKLVMPVDTHVHRIGLRVGFLPPKMTAEQAHDYLLKQLPKNPLMLFSFHKLMIKHGAEVCKWAKPRHENCPLTGICDFYKMEQLRLKEDQKTPKRKIA